MTHLLWQRYDRWSSTHYDLLMKGIGEYRLNKNWRRYDAPDVSFENSDYIIAKCSFLEAKFYTKV